VCEGGGTCVGVEVFDVKSLRRKALEDFPLLACGVRLFDVQLGIFVVYVYVCECLRALSY